VEKNSDRVMKSFVVFPDHSTKEREVKTMELVNKETNKSAQAWTNRSQRRHVPRVDCCSELRSWIQHVILEAEKRKDFDKKDQFLSFLNYL